MTTKSTFSPLFPSLLSLSLVGAFWPGSLSAQGGGVLLATITNPAPASFGLFGSSVAAVGNERVLVGAEGAGAAYLFSLNGDLLTTFRKPDPAAGSFGAVLAPVGNDRVLVGAYNYTIGIAQVGRAYLFSLNGSLLTTFTNPSPASVQGFGFSVAAVGSDLVLIGSGSGGPFLFTTNGTLLTTFTKPASGVSATSLAGVGNDRVLIGAPYDNTAAVGAGAAYLYQTNGTLLVTFTNPIPATDDNFGTSVAAVGNGQVLISAIDYGGSKGTGGAAYLFSTNGTLLTVFTNPTPAAGDFFGWSVAAVGTTRVLIGAYQDSAGAFQSGSAYLFSTNGTLLNTFTNPTASTQAWFGASVAAVGGDHVIVGSVWDNTGASRAGSAYLFDLPYPPLSIARNPATIALSWISVETGLSLQQTDDLAGPTLWTAATNSVSILGPTNVVQQAIANGAPRRFFRLQRP
ncbi:MAG TPA: hypothetical protein VKY92_22240 [Verrucomicrobiae bacterium]|nr:hypothetical protein [Verrucomicrobiae bacterium]